MRGRTIGLKRKKEKVLSTEKQSAKRHSEIDKVARAVKESAGLRSTKTCREPMHLVLVKLDHSFLKSFEFVAVSHAKFSIFV
jgi:hypothetical protein